MSKFHIDLSIDALDKLSFAQIRYMLEEINHSIDHLERSQLELLQSLEEVEDHDLAEAYWENIEVLSRKKDQVARLTNYLEENDMAFYRHNLPLSGGTKAEPNVESSTPQSSQQPQRFVETSSGTSFTEPTEDMELDENFSTDALIRIQQNQSNYNLSGVYL